jgi:prevent-host-death family protein
LAMEAKAETVDATAARASLGDILARARYGGWRFVIQQRGEAAAVVMGYEDYRELMDLLEDLEDVRDMLKTEDEPARPLREYLAERDQSSGEV